MKKWTLEQMRQLEAAQIIDTGQDGKKFPDAQLEYFAQFCEAKGLDPFKREAYLMQDKYGSPIVMVSYHVLFKRAQAAGNFAGLDEIRYNERFDSGNPVHNTKAQLLYQKAEAARVPVTAHCTAYKIVQGVARAFTRSIVVKEYMRGGKMWNGKTYTMIDKVVMTHTLRAMYPDELEGMYIEEEADAIQGNTTAADEETDPEQTTLPRDISRVTEHPADEGNEVDEERVEVINLINQQIEEALGAPVGEKETQLRKLWDSNKDRWSDDKQICKLVGEAKKVAIKLDNPKNENDDKAQ